MSAVILRNGMHVAGSCALEPEVAESCCVLDNESAKGTITIAKQTLLHSLASCFAECLRKDWICLNLIVATLLRSCGLGAEMDSTFDLSHDLQNVRQDGILGFNVFTTVSKFLSVWTRFLNSPKPLSPCLFPLSIHPLNYFMHTQA